MVAVNDSLLAEAIADSIRNGAPWSRLATTAFHRPFQGCRRLMGAVALAGAAAASCRQRVLNSQPDEIIGPMALWRAFCMLPGRGAAGRRTARCSLDSVRAELEGQILERKQREARFAYSRAAARGVAGGHRLGARRFGAGAHGGGRGARAEHRRRHNRRRRARSPKPICATITFTKRWVASTTRTLPCSTAVLNELIENGLLEAAAARSDAAHLPATVAAVRRLSKIRCWSWPISRMWSAPR